MLQNDKINCNGSFRDITMHFVTDPCVNVSILWIIIMYHVKPSCCTAPKIHWDMSNFLVHLKASWEAVVWQWLAGKQEDGNGTAALLLRASQEPPPGWKPLGCPHTVCHKGTLCWDRSCDMAELTLGCPHSPQDRAECLWTEWDQSPGPISPLDTLSSKWEQQHQIHEELEARQKLKQRTHPTETQLNQELWQGPTPASTGAQRKMTHQQCHNTEMSHAAYSGASEPVSPQ